MKKEITYKKKNLFTVVEVEYSDNTILFEIEGIYEDGVTFSSGMYTLEDLIVQLLVLTGKIDHCRTYNLNYPK